MKQEAKLIVIQPDGKRTEQVCDPKDRPELAQLQALVAAPNQNGNALIVPVSRNLSGEMRERGYNIEAYANEEGEIFGMDPNPHGTAAVAYDHMLVGPVILLMGFYRPECELRVADTHHMPGGDVPEHYFDEAYDREAGWGYVCRFCGTRCTADKAPIELNAKAPVRKTTTGDSVAKLSTISIADPDPEKNRVVFLDLKYRKGSRNTPRGYYLSMMTVVLQDDGIFTWVPFSDPAPKDLLVAEVKRYSAKRMQSLVPAVCVALKGSNPRGEIDADPRKCEAWLKDGLVKIRAAVANGSAD